MTRTLPRPPNGVPARFARLVPLWAVATTPLLVMGAAEDAFEGPKALALRAAAFLVAAAGALGYAGPVPAALVGPVAALLACGLLATALSPLLLTSLFGEYTSYQGELHWVALAVLLAALAERARRGETRRLLTAVTLSLAAVSAYALLQLAGLDPVEWGGASPVRRSFSTAGNPLYLGILLAAGFPVSLGVAVTAGAPPARAGKLALSGLIAAGLVASGSRGALAGAAAGTGVFLFLIRRRLPPRFGPAVAVTVALGAAAAGFLVPRDRNPFPLLAARAVAAVRGEDARPLIWAGAARLIASSPLAGHGLASFATLHPGVQHPRLW
ncbi:MAG: O-antigen ligase family protein, partial [bacterium]